MVTYGYWESYYLLVYNWWRHHFQLYGFYYAFSGVPRGKNVFNMEYLEGRKVFLILNRDLYLQQRQYFGPNIWKRRSLKPRGFVIDIYISFFTIRCDLAQKPMKSFIKEVGSLQAKASIFFILTYVVVHLKIHRNWQKVLASPYLFGPEGT